MKFFNPVIANPGEGRGRQSILLRATERKMDCRVAALLAMTAALLASCSPTVKVEAPDKPIEINLNVNIEHRVKIEIEKDVQAAIKKNKDIF